MLRKCKSGLFSFNMLCLCTGSQGVSPSASDGCRALRLGNTLSPACYLSGHFSLEIQIGATQCSISQSKMRL